MVLCGRGTRPRSPRESTPTATGRTSLRSGGLTSYSARSSCRPKGRLRRGNHEPSPLLHSPFAKASKPGSGPRRRSALRLASSGSLFGESRARVATRAERQGRGGDVGGAVSTAAAVGVASAAGTSVPAEGGRAEAGAASAAAAAAAASATAGAGRRRRQCPPVRERSTRERANVSVPLQYAPKSAAAHVPQVLEGLPSGSSSISCCSSTGACRRRRRASGRGRLCRRPSRAHTAPSHVRVKPHRCAAVARNGDLKRGPIPARGEALPPSNERARTTRERPAGSLWAAAVAAGRICGSLHAPHAHEARFGMGQRSAAR